MTLYQAGATAWIGAAMSAVGLGQSVLSQGIALHQQEQALQQQHQQPAEPMQVCPAGFKHTVVIHADGSRTVECAQDEVR